MTVPNVLTLFRILLTPVLAWLLIDRMLNAALVVFVLAGLTDGLDGLIARVFDQKSKLGAYLDPIADKLLLVCSFVLLWHLDMLPGWLMFITVTRDIVIVCGLIALLCKQVPFEIRPTAVSKATTLMQLITILSVLGSSLFPLSPWNYDALYITTGVLTLASGCHYVKAGLDILEAHRLCQRGAG